MCTVALCQERILVQIIDNTTEPPRRQQHTLVGDSVPPVFEAQLGAVWVVSGCLGTGGHGSKSQ